MGQVGGVGRAISGSRGSTCVLDPTRPTYLPYPTGLT
jgi:hypothetical protein